VGEGGREEIRMGGRGAVGEEEEEDKRKRGRGGIDTSQI